MPPKKNPQRERVLDLWDLGYDTREIMRELNLTRETVSGIVTKARKLGDPRAWLRKSPRWVSKVHLEFIQGPVCRTLQEASSTRSIPVSELCRRIIVCSTRDGVDSIGEILKDVKEGRVIMARPKNPHWEEILDFWDQGRDVSEIASTLGLKEKVVYHVVRYAREKEDPRAKSRYKREEFPESIQIRIKDKPGADRILAAARVRGITPSMLIRRLVYVIATDPGCNLIDNILCDTNNFADDAEDNEDSSDNEDETKSDGDERAVA